MRIQWQEGKKWTTNRVEWLEKKFSTKKKNARFQNEKGILVENDDIEEFERQDGVTEEVGFVVYGDIVLTKEEREYLNLSPKFREFELLDVNKWHVEVEANAIKTRWELMGRIKKQVQLLNTGSGRIS